MKESTVKRLALVLAIQAEIDGMEHENMLRDQFDESHAYSVVDFCAKAEELRVMSSKHEDEL
jgi:hypothetical protein